MIRTKDLGTALDLLELYDAYPEDDFPVDPVHDHSALPDSPVTYLHSGDDERLWVLVGKRQGSIYVCTTHQDTFAVGTPGSVDVVRPWVYNRQDRYHDVVGFYHEHPSGMPVPSSIDDDAMETWVQTEGRDLLCAIAYGKYDESTFEGINVYQYTRSSKGRSYIQAKHVELIKNSLIIVIE